jgi:hypothetical protein
LTVDGKVFTVRGLFDREESGPWTRQIKATMDAAMRTRTRPIDMDVAVRVQLTYAALEWLAGRMSGVPGRKNIVWITDGVPLVLGPMRSDTLESVAHGHPPRNLWCHSLYRLRLSPDRRQAATRS